MRETTEDDAVAELESDLPSSIDSNVSERVLSANASLDFLESDGSLNPDRTFLLELTLLHLPRGLTQVVLRFDGSQRRIYIYRDEPHAHAQIQLISEDSEMFEDDRVRLEYHLEYSGYVFETPLKDEVECSAVREPLRVLSSEYLREHVLEANDLTAMIDAASNFGRCGETLDDFDPATLVRVEGATPEITGTQSTLTMNELRQGRTPSPLVQIVLIVRLNRRKRLTISTRSGMGLQGQAIEGTSQRYIVERKSRATLNSMDDAETFGTTSNAVVGTSVASSVGVTIGASVAASTTGTAVSTSAGSATAGGSTTGAIEMLQRGQTIYLISKMAVPNMPENFKAFGDSFAWTMLDLRVPWKNEEDVEIYASNKTTPSESSNVAVVRKEWPYERLVEVLFWGVLFGLCLLVLHIIAIIIIFHRRWNLPNILRFPRLELLFLYWGVPTFAGACATLFSGTANQRELGVILLFVLPVPFLLWHVYLLNRTFVFKPPERFHVFYEVQSMKTMLTSRNIQPQDDHVVIQEGRTREEKEKGMKGFLQKYNFIETFILTPLLGPPYDSGTWKTVEGPSNKFLDRYGPVFEDFRHIPGLRRHQLAGAMAEGVLTLGCYGILFYVLENNETDDQEIRRKVGYALIILQAVTFIMTFYEVLMGTIEVLRTITRYLWELIKREPQIVGVIHRAGLYSPSYLERKYFHKWVKKTLGKGLYDGVLKKDESAPIEERFWAAPGAAMRSCLCPSSCCRTRPKKETRRSQP